MTHSLTLGSLLLTEARMSEEARSVPPMDDIEGSWDRQLTNREVGQWCVDLIESFSDSNCQPTDKTRAQMRRLLELDEQELVLTAMAHAAVFMSRELRFYIDMEKMLPIDASGDEKFKRALLSTRATFRGESRLPTQPAEEG